MFRRDTEGDNIVEINKSKTPRERGQYDVHGPSKKCGAILRTIGLRINRYNLWREMSEVFLCPTLWFERMSILRFCTSHKTELWRLSLEQSHLVLSTRSELDLWFSVPITCRFLFFKTPPSLVWSRMVLSGRFLYCHWEVWYSVLQDLCNTSGHLAWTGNQTPYPQMFCGTWSPFPTFWNPRAIHLHVDMFQ